MTILNLSHTNINSDSRILKEMQVIANHYPKINLVGIGVEQKIGNKSTEENKNFSIYSIILKSKQFTFLPKSIRHLFSLIELYFKMFLKAYKLKPDIIHCHDVFVLPVAVSIKKITKSKLIYDAHELESDVNSIPKTLGKIIFYIEKFSWSSIDNLIVVSPSINKWYQNNIGAKSSEIILNSPFLKKNNTIIDNNYLRNFFSINKNSKIFIYVGGLVRGRGIDLIIEVFKDPNITSSIVFLGYGELQEELNKLSKKYANIYVHDAVAHEKVVSIVQSADVGLCLIQNVSLSDYYCLPNKLFEYTFAGIHILASDFPDISKVVNDYNLGKCTKLDKDNIYQKIIGFENMQQLPVIDQKKLYDLSWEAQENKLIKLYNILIEG